MERKDLLEFFEQSITKGATLAEFEGKRIAVDAISVLQQVGGEYAKELTSGQIPAAFIEKSRNFISMISSYKISPIFVMKGRDIPASQQHREEERMKREEYLKRAVAYEEKGNLGKAKKAYTKALEITYEIFRSFLNIIRELKMDYIISPYDASAQIAYLCKKNIVKGAISDDRNLIPLECETVAYNLQITGTCDMYKKRDLKNTLKNEGKGHGFHQTRWLCILLGCDYAPRMEGIRSLIARNMAFASVFVNYEAMFQCRANIVGKERAPSREYIECFKKAEETFIYHLVLDPKLEVVLPLHQYPTGKEPRDFPFVGQMIEGDVAVQMAIGNVHPITMARIGDYDPMQNGYGRGSIWWRRTLRISPISSPLSNLPDAPDEPVSNLVPVVQQEHQVPTTGTQASELSKPKPSSAKTDDEDHDHDPGPSRKRPCKSSDQQKSVVLPTNPKPKVKSQSKTFSTLSSSKKKNSTPRGLQVGLSRNVATHSKKKDRPLDDLIKQTNERYGK